MKRLLTFALLLPSTLLAQSTGVPPSSLPPAGVSSAIQPSTVPPSTVPPTSAEPSSPDAPQTTFSIGTTLVRVPANVNTKAGEPVFTLTSEDFIVTDDGVPQKVRVEEDTGAQPISLIVCVEVGNAGAGHLDDYTRLLPLLESMVGAVPHQVAVVGFDSEPRLLRGFTADLGRIDSAIQNADAGNNGAAILDALSYSVKLLDKRPSSDRRAILLLSETLDHGSHIRLQEAVRAVSDTNTTIYSLAFSSTKSETEHEAAKLLGDPTPGPASGCLGEIDKLAPDAPENKFSQAFGCLSLLAPPLRLVKIATLLAINSLRKNVPEAAARLTGGEYLPFSSEKSFERGLYTLGNHLPNQYVLSFTPSAPHPGLHTIGLTMKDRPQLKVTARGSYWAEDAAVKDAR